MKGIKTKIKQSKAKGINQKLKQNKKTTQIF